MLAGMALASVARVGTAPGPMKALQKPLNVSSETTPSSISHCCGVKPRRASGPSSSSRPGMFAKRRITLFYTRNATTLGHKRSPEGNMQTGRDMPPRPHQKKPHL